MKCPIDATDLLITDRSGIEIDYCPQCRGVWLDRGELDKIIDRAPNDVRTDAYNSGVARGSHGQYEVPAGERNQPVRRKREGFLGDLFDF
ncbi:zf-TFIIB domain-containing protein [Microbacterium insulae]|uniref:Zf-TFIIB domain-containing protein n=1 Tax=Microbacterium insulae TaxID=483014 RepID=A0ABW3AMV9_9MICO